jgi:polyisoprenyl-teichoic acid--peptidoglycan teichoic acid transferase
MPSGHLEYYGAMGTTWSDPPILRNPSETRKIGGREYDLFYDGGRLRLVGWREKGNSYWLSNTLTQSIGEAEMLAVATSMREI